MPGFFTHYFFGVTTLEKETPSEIPLGIKNYPNSFHIGLQGPDIFFYYIPAYLFRKKNIGNVMHKDQVLNYFNALLSFRNQLSSKKEKQIADAYILGFIGHYSLDTYTHPYVFARCNHNKYKSQYSLDFGRHVQLETDIDRAVLWKFQYHLPSHFGAGETIALSKEEATVISSLVAQGTKAIYPDYCLSSFHVKGAMSCMKWANRLMHDPFGWKKTIVRKIELLLFHHPVISSMIPSDKTYYFKDPCNTLGKYWRHPFLKNVTSNESFFHLFQSAAEAYLERIYLYKKAISSSEKQIDFSSLVSHLGNCSYDSGLPLDS